MKPFLALIIVGLAIICYVNVLHAPFVWDDLALQPQFHVQSFHDVFQWGEDRPVLMASYRLNGYFSQDPFWFHLTNLLFHVINCLLVYALCFNMSQGKPDVGFAGGALFAVHPLFSEAVASIAGRSSLLCATFYFAALLCAWKGLWSFGMVKIAKNAKAKDVQVKYTKFHLYRTAGYLFLYVVFSLLAIYTKPEWITLIPLVLMLWWIREGFTTQFVAALAFCGIAAFVIVTGPTGSHFIDIASSVQHNTELETAGFNSVLPMAKFVPTYAVALVGYYYFNMLVPHRLSVEPEITVYTARSWEFAGVCIILLFFTLLMFDRYQTRPFRYAMACLLISPISAYAIFPMADPVLEHRAYISGLALALFFGLLINKLKARSAEFITMAVIIVGVILTISHNAVWESPMALWEQAVSADPVSARARTNLGREYQQSGAIGRAVREYNYALDLKPDDYGAESNLAGIYLDNGNFEVAGLHLKHITTVAPDFPEGWINYAVLLLRTNHAEQALNAIDTAIKLKPQSAAYINKVDILRRLGRLDEASRLENLAK